MTWADPGARLYYTGATNMELSDDGLAAWTDLKSAEKDIADLKEQVKDAVARKRDAESRLRSALQDAVDGQGRLPLGEPAPKVPFDRVTISSGGTTVDLTEHFNAGKSITSEQAAKLNASKPGRRKAVTA